MTDKWMNKKMGNSDFCDCAAEFYKRNVRRFLPWMIIYGVLFAAYSYCITDVMDVSSVFEMDSGFAALTYILKMYLAIGFSGLMSFVGMVITGMLTYYTFTKIMSGKEPSKKYTFKRGFVYALFMMLFGLVSGAVLYVVLMAVVLISAFSIVSLANLTGVTWILIVILVGIPLLILAAYLYGRLSLSAPMMITTNRQIFKSMKESWRLTKKKSFKTLVFIVSVSIFISSATNIVAAAAAIGVYESNFVVKILTAIVNGVAAISGFVTPIAYVFYIVYHDGKNGYLEDEIKLNAFLKERGV